MPKAAVDAVIINNGAVVLVKRKKEPFKGFYALPGGFLEEYESYEQALKREVKEETGLEVEILSIVNAYSSKERDPRDVATVAFLCYAKNFNVKKHSEETEVVIKPLYEALNMKLAFDHNAILKDAVNAYVHYAIDKFLYIARLNKAPVLFIDKGNDFQRLVFVFLSSRTKDETTYKAWKRLFSRFEKPEEIANADTKLLEELIKPVAFYREKAKRLKEMCNVIAKDKKILENREELLKIKGIGKKSVNVYFSEKGKPYIGVDTHVHRIANRLCLVKTKTPSETEEILDILNEENKKQINLTFVAYGQTICKAKNPLCNVCPLFYMCGYDKKSLGKNDRVNKDDEIKGG